MNRLMLCEVGVNCVNAIKYASLKLYKKLSFGELHVQSYTFKEPDNFTLPYYIDEIGDKINTLPLLLCLVLCQAYFDSPRPVLSSIFIVGKA